MLWFQVGEASSSHMDFPEGILWLVLFRLRVHWRHSFSIPLVNTLHSGPMLNLTGFFLHPSMLSCQSSFVLNSAEKKKKNTVRTDTESCWKWNTVWKIIKTKASPDNLKVKWASILCCESLTFPLSKKNIWFRVSRSFKIHSPLLDYQRQTMQDTSVEHFSAIKIGIQSSLCAILYR